VGICAVGGAQQYSRHETQYLNWYAGSAMLGTFEARCAIIDCTATLLASDIPCTSDGRAILSLTNRGTSPARFEFVGNVKAFEIASEAARASDGARSESHRAKRSGPRLVHVALLVRIVGWFRVVRFAAEIVLCPIPCRGTLRGRMVMRARLVRNTAAVVLAP